MRCRSGRDLGAQGAVVPRRGVRTPSGSGGGPRAHMPTITRRRAGKRRRMWRPAAHESGCVRPTVTERLAGVSQGREGGASGAQASPSRGPSDSTAAQVQLASCSRTQRAPGVWLCRAVPATMVSAAARPPDSFGQRGEEESARSRHEQPGGVSARPPDESSDPVLEPHCPSAGEVEPLRRGLNPARACTYWT